MTDRAEGNKGDWRLHVSAEQSQIEENWIKYRTSSLAAKEKMQMDLSVSSQFTQDKSGKEKVCQLQSWSSFETTTQWE